MLSRKDFNLGDSYLVEQIGKELIFVGENISKGSLIFADPYLGVQECITYHCLNKKGFSKDEQKINSLKNNFSEIIDWGIMKWEDSYDGIRRLLKK